MIVRIANTRASLIAPCKQIQSINFILRYFHQSSCHRSQNESLTLAFEKHDAPPESNSNNDTSSPKAVVLCHGLFGSKQNWRSIGRAIAKRMKIPVYAIDFRNHGQSPHANSMSYIEMSKDLEKFFKDHKINQAALVGHSMGGKAVMTMALENNQNNQELISHLISVDMSPARGKLSNEFAQYVESMIEIEESKCKSRQEADKILEIVEPNLGIRQFLLTNLTRSSNDEFWTFRIPIHTIKNRLAEQVGDFPFNDEKDLMNDSSKKNYPKASFSGPTLFIKGENSKYINRKNIPICDSFFPNAKHSTLSTGHWVQAEKPQEFIDELCKFVGKG